MSERYNRYRYNKKVDYCEQVITLTRIKAVCISERHKCLINSALQSCRLELEGEEKDFVFGLQVRRVFSEPLLLLGSTESEVGGF